MEKLKILRYELSGLPVRLNFINSFKIPAVYLKVSEVLEPMGQDDDVLKTDDNVVNCLSKYF